MFQLRRWKFERMFTPDHASHVTCQVSHVKCQVSCVMCNIFFWTKLLISSVEGLLSMGFPLSSYCITKNLNCLCRKSVVCFKRTARTNFFGKLVIVFFWYIFYFRCRHLTHLFFHWVLPFKSCEWLDKRWFNRHMQTIYFLLYRKRKKLLGTQLDMFFLHVHLDIEKKKNYI